MEDYKAPSNGLGNLMSRDTVFVLLVAKRYEKSTARSVKQDEAM